MSLFSRLFGKAPPMVARPEKAIVRLDAPLPQPERPLGELQTPERAAVAAKEEEELKAAIAAGDVQAIARFVIQGSSTKVRQQAAHAIEDPEQLRQLIKEVRGGKDKTVYKILTQKRDAALAQTRQVEQRRAEVEAAAVAIERHSHRPYDAVFTPTKDQHQIRWQAVAAAAEPELEEKVEAVLDGEEEVV